MKSRDSGDRGDGMPPRITAKAANRPARQPTVSYLTVTSQRAGRPVAAPGQLGSGPLGGGAGVAATLAATASRAITAGTRRPER